MKQVLVQFTPELLADLDAYSKREGKSRSEVVREAVERVLHEDREARIDREVVEAYTRLPEEDDPWGDWAVRELFADEPWEGPRREQG